ncbi:MAG: purine-binding chemotaxis protein CheW [Gammaproteobacteria bacterium]|nr:MAG: purine-binding chemotaxis protein CheW [Gammaproteobacteria bacterium]
MGDAPALADLREQPFDLLLALERCGLQAAEDSIGNEEHEWVGMAFRLGEQVFVSSRDEVREVLVYPDVVSRIPGSKPWLTGLANVRGQLLPVIDLQAFLGGATTRPGRETRLIVVNHRDVPAGLVVDEVLGFRRFPTDDRSADAPDMVLRCERYLRGAFRQDSDNWPVFELAALVESPQFLNAGRLPA